MRAGVRGFPACLSTSTRAPPAASGSRRNRVSTIPRSRHARYAGGSSGSSTPPSASSSRARVSMRPTPRRRARRAPPSRPTLEGRGSRATQSRHRAARSHRPAARRRKLVELEQGVMSVSRPGEDRHLRRLWLLLVPGRRPRGEGRHAVRSRPPNPVLIGRSRAVPVAFLPRHGAEHVYPPHKINYRANVWAMKELGVERIIGPCAAGSLQPEVKPGDFVVCRSARRPDDGTLRHFLRRPPDDAHLVRRSVLPRAPHARSEGGGRRGHLGARQGNGRHDPRAPLLDPCRIQVVPPRGLGRDQHDAVPRGVPRTASSRSATSTSR